MRFVAQKLSSKSVTANIFLIGCLLAIGVYYFASLSHVPFHPDESTQLYTSADIEDFFADPLSLSYIPGNSVNQRLLYRVLDAPLTRYVIGLGRLIMGQKALPVDWDWSRTWLENTTAGALPAHSLLLTARLSVAVVFPISIILFYLTIQNIAGKFTALLGTLFFALNALILLHTRRAMAENILIFTILLSLWFRFQPIARSSLWTIAIPIALAINAKQSAAGLLLTGFITLLLFQPDISCKKRLLSIFLFMGIIVSITFLMNPFLWADPLSAIKFAIESRQDLLTRQVQEIRNVRPDLVFDTIPERLAGILTHVYFTPPAIADIGNYLEDTRAAENVYFSTPLTQLGRGLTWGSVSFFVSTFGFVVGTLQLFKLNQKTKPGFNADPLSKIAWIWVATLSQALINLFFFAIPFQRYVIPLIPYACFWSAYGMVIIINMLIRKKPFIPTS